MGSPSVSPVKTAAAAAAASAAAAAAAAASAAASARATTALVPLSHHSLPPLSPHLRCPCACRSRTGSTGSTSSTSSNSSNSSSNSSNSSNNSSSRGGSSTCGSWTPPRRRTSHRWRARGTSRDRAPGRRGDQRRGC
jgi:hypothetical protein